MLGISAALSPPASRGLCAGMAPALLCCSTATIAAVTGSLPACINVYIPVSKPIACTPHNMTMQSAWPDQNLHSMHSSMWGVPVMVGHDERCRGERYLCWRW